MVILMFTAFKNLFAATVGLVATPDPVVIGPPRQKTIGPTIAIINQTSVLIDSQVQQAVNDLQIQIDRDFGPIWNTGANLVFVGKGAVPPAGAWVIYMLDHSDQQGALGYHNEAGNVPVGKVFAKDDLQYHLSWTVTLSHETLEMLGDPEINLTAFRQNTNTTGTLFAFENCDSVEDDSLGYKINNTLVSDFVTPAWFDPAATPGSTKFDFCGHLNAPFTLAPGGYISVFEVAPNTTGWTQATHASGPGKRLLSKGPESRKARRCG
jgi:hypothetical protein